MSHREILTAAALAVAFPFVFVGVLFGLPGAAVALGVALTARKALEVTIPVRKALP